MMTVLSLSLMPMSAYAQSSTTSAAGTVVSVDAKSSSAAAETRSVPQAKITKDEAVVIVKTLFPKLKDAEASRVELGNNHSFPAPYQNVWDISWEIRRGNSSYGFNSMVDSMTGELLQTHLSTPFDDESYAYYPPKVTEEEALELAKAFIIKASKGLSESNIRYHQQDAFREGSLFGPVQYSFVFSTLVNGLPSPSESIMVTVNGNGEVTGYNRNRTGIEYPSPTPAVTLEKAAGKYQSAMNLMLQYTPVYEPYSQNRSWFLSWAPSFNGELSIDAQTGQFLNFAGEVVEPDSPQYKPVMKTDQTFTAVQGQAEDGLLTAEQASAIVGTYMPAVKERTLSWSQLNNYWNDKNKRVWNLGWSEKSPAGPYGGRQSSAVVDASTGQILELRENQMLPPYQQPRSEGGESTKAITAEDAEEKAIALLNVLYPKASEELKRMTLDPYGISPGTQKQFNFKFQRFLNEIPVIGDITTMALDESGKLIAYYSNRSSQIEAAVSGLEAKTTKAQAEAAFKEKTKLELQYKQFGGFYTENQYFDPNMKLAYGLTFKVEKMTAYAYDATTGEWRSLIADENKPSNAGNTLPSDVQGHWAQQDLEPLIRHGILQPNDDGKLQPDQKITVGQWLKMVADAASNHYGGRYYGDAPKPLFEDVEPNSPYYEAVQLFVQSQWVDPKGSSKLGVEELLTREKLAVLLVNMMKYDKLGVQVNQNVQLPFADRDEVKDRGAVWLAVQLGLFDQTQERFIPTGTVTKAEAASVLMRIVYLQGKLDQPILN